MVVEVSIVMRSYNDIERMKNSKNGIKTEIYRF